MKKCVAISLSVLMMGSLSACMTNSEPSESDVQKAMAPRLDAYACIGAYDAFPVKDQGEASEKYYAPMVKAGLLKEVSKVPNPNQFGSKWLLSYDLTEEGKKYVRIDSSGKKCLQWATAKVGKVETILQSKLIDGYEVDYKLEIDVNPWAKDIKTDWFDTHALEQELEGKKRSAFLVKNVDGDWITK